jgi:hypothetical protein
LARLRTPPAAAALAAGDGQCDPRTGLGRLATNLFAVSPVIISDLRLPILAMIAKWLLVIIVGLILTGLQPKPTGVQKSSDDGPANPPAK